MVISKISVEHYVLNCADFKSAKQYDGQKVFKSGLVEIDTNRKLVLALKRNFSKFITDV